MRRSLLGLLRCPACRSELSCEGTFDAADRVVEGVLRCAACPSEYPIVRGIPRFVAQWNYTASFGEQWQRFRTAQLDRWNGTRISQRRLLSETGRSEAWWPGKNVLDVGCGAGRFMDVAARLGADVIGVDASLAVDAAAENLRGERTIDLVQADLYALPFAPASFDLVYCIGVVQHTPDPKRAVAALPPFVRAGGEVAITAYERRMLTPLFSKYLIRVLLRPLSPSMKMRLIEGAMPVLFPVTDVLFRIPVLGKFFRFVIPVANYVDMPELTRTMRYEWALLDTVDMLSPAFDEPQREGELSTALRSAGVHEVRRLPNPGLNLIGRRSAA